MKILVFLHELVLGGTTVNSIELAAALRDLHGHEVVFFATPGPMQQMVLDHGLRLIPAPVVRTHPSPARMRALRQAIRDEQPDLLHVWEIWPCIDAYWAAHVPLGMPMLVTDMRMEVTPLLPRALHTTFGTPEVLAQARAAGRRRTRLLLPPVDTRSNSMDCTPVDDFRAQWSVSAEQITLVTVSRLEDAMKGESLARTLQAVRRLGHELPLRLLVVGDGAARARTEQQAAEVNDHLGCEAVTLTGAMRDPRAAYAAADIVLGMGSSALRALAYGKPLIVLGERGFARAFTRGTAAHFHHTGFYGVGDGSADNTPLEEVIRRLAGRRDRAASLGEFSRRFVRENYALDVVARQLSDHCNAALADAAVQRVDYGDVLRSAALYLREQRFRWRAAPPPPMCFQDEGSRAGALALDESMPRG